MDNIPVAIPVALSLKYQILLQRVSSIEDLPELKTLLVEYYSQLESWKVVAAEISGQGSMSPEAKALNSRIRELALEDYKAKVEELNREGVIQAFKDLFTEEAQRSLSFSQKIGGL